MDALPFQGFGHFRLWEGQWCAILFVLAEVVHGVKADVEDERKKERELTCLERWSS